MSVPLSCALEGYVLQQRPARVVELLTIGALALATAIAATAVFFGIGRSLIAGALELTDSSRLTLALAIVLPCVLLSAFAAVRASLRIFSC